MSNLAFLYIVMEMFWVSLWTDVVYIPALSHLYRVEVFPSIPSLFKDCCYKWVLDLSKITSSSDMIMWHFFQFNMSFWTSSVSIMFPMSSLLIWNLSLPFSRFTSNIQDHTSHWSWVGFYNQYYFPSVECAFSLFRMLLVTTSMWMPSLYIYRYLASWLIL